CTRSRSGTIMTMSPRCASRPRPCRSPYHTRQHHHHPFHCLPDLIRPRGQWPSSLSGSYFSPTHHLPGP
ncbi:hypothetical protein E4U34_007417, partial [Claviceps purpurea]